MLISLTQTTALWQRLFLPCLDEMDGLSDQEKADYKAKNKKAIDEHFVPAYERLISGLKA